MDQTVHELQLIIPGIDLHDLFLDVTIPLKQQKLAEAYYSKIVTGLVRGFELSAHEEDIFKCL